MEKNPSRSNSQTVKNVRCEVKILKSKGKAMRVMVTYEARLLKTRSGDIYSRGGLVNPRRYLQVFDEVVVFARVEQVAQEKLDRFLLDWENISFFPLPYYVGPWKFLKQYQKINALAKQALQEADAFIIRVPGTTGTLLWRQLMKRGIPYGVEVTGDPWDVFAPGGVKTVLRPFIRHTMSKNLIKQCRHASVAAYVTEYTLQKRYPPGCWSTHYSSIELPPEAFADESIIEKRMKSIAAKVKSHLALRICYVGTLAQLYKGPDILIQAVADCIAKGLNLELIVVGDGQFRPQLERQVQESGIGKQVRFTGTVLKKEVFKVLDQTDLYVLPSLTEGLPCSVIEAAARGIPCISSNIGGIPELLESEDLVPPGDPQALAQKIEQVISDRSRLERMAQRNLKSARKYSKDKLDQRRKILYEKLAEITKSKNYSGEND